MKLQSKGFREFRVSGLGPFRVQGFGSPVINLEVKPPEQRP